MNINQKLLFNQGKKASGPVIPGDTGLGPTTLVGSYQNPNDPQKFAGYYGTITATNFFTGTQVASGIGLSGGTAINDTTIWMKFILDGKIILIPQKPIRYGSFWNNLYAVGAVYGDGTTGTFPATTPVIQSAVVSRSGYSYRVRLIHGYNSDPAAQTTAADAPVTFGSEWNRLLYNVCSSVTPSSQQGTKWASFTNADMGFNGSTGSISIVQETTSSTNNSIGLLRGFNGVDGCTYGSKSNINNNGGWRPALELII